MNLPTLDATRISVGRQQGASPVDDCYYVLILFDISDAKKSRLLVKTLKSYGRRIQKSVFEAQIKKSQIKELIIRINRLMFSQNYDEKDNIRLYEISGHCNVTIFGEYSENYIEDNIFI